MATIKLEILLDSENRNDVLSFANLMNAFSGAPSVQLVTSKHEFPLEALKRTVEAQSPSSSSQVTVTATEAEENTTADPVEYSEAEMLAMLNTDLKDYATSLGIDWAKAEGKNTNRKLADLVLAFRNGEPKEEQSPAAEAAKDEAEAEAEEEAPTETAEDAPTTLTYNDLKVSLGKKVDEHREAIVAKLAEYGATKMPNLDEEHWVDMFNFMEAL